MTAVVCAIASGHHEGRADGRALLERAVARAGLWECLDAVAAGAQRAPAKLRVLILPELLCFDAGAPAGTESALVEQLVDLLGEHGYDDVAVGMTLGTEHAWLDRRDLATTASVAGYRRVTDGLRPYEILDLCEDVVAVAFAPESALYGSGLARRWVEADFRISFAKNRTHEEHGFALCVHNLMGALPLRDKLYHYRGRLKPWDVCLDLLRQTPPHFAVIDAVRSNHGSWSSRAPQSLDTATIIASADALLADWTGAVKMGLDPHMSAINQRALTELGLPAAYDVVGDLTPYEGWRNVHPALVTQVRRVNESVALGRALSPLTTRVDAELFPFKNAALQRVNRALSGLLGNSGATAPADSAAVWVHASLASGVEALDAWRVLFAKHQLRWRDVPLDLDLGAFGPADYEAIDDYIEPLEQLIAATPGDHSGLRWRYLDGSVLFEFSRVLPIAFEQFVARVDISRAISYMQDYIGGRRVAVGRDDLGRVTHQAERNIYLPQPNYLVLYGGTVIDVTKLEHVRYHDGEHKIVWRTRTSANGSAEYDDGSVRFTDVGGSYTEITVVARQKFTLPLFWQAVDLDQMPEIKDVLVGDAYFTFFDGTMANFELAYEGREYRVGRPWDGAEGELDAFGPAALRTPDVGAMVTRAAQLVARLTSSATSTSSASASASAPAAAGDAGGGRLDEHGFRHFSAPTPRATAGRRDGDAGPIGQFLSELGAAVARDLGLDAGEE